MKPSLNKTPALLALLPFLIGEASLAAPAARARWLMGTVCEIAAHGPAAPEATTAAFEEIARWDAVLSLYNENSELSALNREAARAPFPCSESLWEAVTLSLEQARLSGGAFDPTVLPVLAKKEGSRDLVGYERVKIDPARRSVLFTRPGMGLTLDGIGKGLALDHAARVLRERGVRSALINFGGQVYALGSPPGREGWPVRIGGRAEALMVKDASVSTSGTSERPGHIVSPLTGERIMRQDSVTVLAATGAEADAWSTALFVLGRKVPAAFKGRVFYSHENRAKGERK